MLPCLGRNKYLDLVRNREFQVQKVSLLTDLGIGDDFYRPFFTKLGEISVDLTGIFLPGSFYFWPANAVPMIKHKKRQIFPPYSKKKILFYRNKVLRASSDIYKGFNIIRYLWISDGMSMIIYKPKFMFKDGRNINFVKYLFSLWNRYVRLGKILNHNNNFRSICIAEYSQQQFISSSDYYFLIKIIIKGD